MKRAVCILVLHSAIVAIGCAQYFVEGSLDAGFNSSRYLFIYHSDNESPSNFFFNISPLAGYQLNDRISVGAKASYIRRKEKQMRPEPDTGDDVEWVLRTPGCNVAGLCRYKIAGQKKISFLIESTLFIGGNNFLEKRDAKIHRDESHFSFGINMTPLVTYDLTEKFSLVASAEFLSFDLSFQTDKDKTNSMIFKDIHFGFTGKTEIYRFLPSVRIGFIYHFNKPIQ